VRENGEMNRETLKLMTSLLNMAGDCYTYWNYRKKNFLLKLSETENESELSKIHLQELSWLETMVQQHPKSYWVWFHRKWLSQQIKNMNWKREIELCDIALESDQRNFHCWNYRRFVENVFNVPNEQELAFTTKKIEQNFSNYSSWHQRSYILDKIYQDKQQNEFNLVLESELKWLQNAFYTSPDDQSAWFYHRWLMNQVKIHNSTKYESVVAQELEKIDDLLQEEPNSRWATLTSVFLMKELNSSSKEEILKRITKLQKLDPLRINYYKSLEQKEL